MRCEDIYSIFSNLPTLETKRLVLRRMLVSDCYDMFEYARLPEVTEHLTWSPHANLDYTKEYLAHLSHHYRLGDFYDWALILKEENKMIGTCGFTRFHFPHDSAEVGYVINPGYRGRGIAPEALAAVLAFGFETVGLHRIEAKFVAENEASRRVMEKVGMRFEGIAREGMKIKERYRDVGTCAILAADFQKGE